VTGQQSGKTPDKPLDVFMVAGESSADDLGARFMRSLCALRPTSFRGVGGPRMNAAGLASLYPAQGLTSIGIATVVVRLKGSYGDCASAVAAGVTLTSSTSASLRM